jgi:hypothetical protein
MARAVLLMALVAPSTGAIVSVDVRTLRLNYDLHAYAFVDMQRYPEFVCSEVGAEDALKHANAADALKLMWGRQSCKAADARSVCLANEASYGLDYLAGEPEQSRLLFLEEDVAYEVCGLSRYNDPEIIGAEGSVHVMRVDNGDSLFSFHSPDLGPRNNATGGAPSCMSVAQHCSFSMGVLEISSSDCSQAPECAILNRRECAPLAPPHASHPPHSPCPARGPQPAPAPSAQVLLGRQHVRRLPRVLHPGPQRRWLSPIHAAYNAAPLCPRPRPPDDPHQDAHALPALRLSTCPPRRAGNTTNSACVPTAAATTLGAPYLVTDGPANAVGPAGRMPTTLRIGWAKPDCEPIDSFKVRATTTTTTHPPSPTLHPPSAPTLSRPPHPLRAPRPPPPPPPPPPPHTLPYAPHPPTPTPTYPVPRPGAPA